jgi:hypothetical protein
VKWGNHINLRTASSAALLAFLAACVTVQPPQIERGRYTNFREMAYSRAQMMRWDGVPETLQNQMRTCLIDTLYPYYTKAEITRLDAYARGENQLTIAEYNQIDRQMADRVGGESALLAALQANCPDTLRAFKAYGAKP